MENCMPKCLSFLPSGYLLWVTLLLRWTRFNVNLLQNLTLMLFCHVCLLCNARWIVVTNGRRVGALKNVLQKRFGDFMSTDHFGENSKLKTAIIAAVTHPLLSWCGYPILRWRKSIAEGLFLRELHKIESLQDEVSPSANRLLYGFASVHSKVTSCATCSGPPLICPAPCICPDRPLSFWPWKWCPSHVWRGLPLYQF